MLCACSTFFCVTNEKNEITLEMKRQRQNKAFFFHYAGEEEYSMCTVSLVLNWNCSPELLTGWQTPANSDKQQCREFNLNGQRCLWNCTHISAFNSQLIFIWRLFLSHTRTLKPHNACQSHVYTKNTEDSILRTMQTNIKKINWKLLNASNCKHLHGIANEKHHKYYPF